MSTELHLPAGVQPVEDRGDGPPVLWLPSCFAESAWLPVHDLVAAHHRVVVPAAPTLQDGGVLQRVRTMADYVLHLVGLLDAVGLERPVVVGTSFGGWAAAELAASRPDRVGALAVVDAMGLRVDGWPAAELFACSLPELAALVLHDRRAVDVAALPSFDRTADPVASVARMIVAQEAMAHLGWSPYLHDPQLPARLAARYRGPALVVWGEDDRVLPEAYAHAWADLLGAPVEIVAGAGHLPGIEQPEAVAAMVTRWLAAGQSGSSSSSDQSSA